MTKAEIGAIRIGATETQFQVPSALAARFAAAVKATANADGEDESGVRIERMPNGAAPIRNAGAPPQRRHGAGGGAPRGGPRPRR